MRQLLTILILTSSISIAFGQKNETITFHDFDISANAPSGTREIVTDKIVFPNDNKLDIKKSKPALDSLVWFLSRHPKAIISLTLLKTQSITSVDNQLGQKQCKQIVDFLSRKGINSKRIVSAVSYDEQKATNNLQASTRIRVLSNDFTDADTK